MRGKNECVVKVTGRQEEKKHGERKGRLGKSRKKNRHRLSGKAKGKVERTERGEKQVKGNSLHGRKKKSKQAEGQGRRGTRMKRIDGHR